MSPMGSTYVETGTAELSPLGWEMRNLASSWLCEFRQAFINLVGLSFPDC